ncbi:transcriptional regulator [Rivularia sp. PCC 7116]|uniref:TetR family transcriptional regulator n=1 Tax=Rivularia sp. PCC 7116 TaxID=373994 RepID=UPI00029EE2B7|nr:TetR family transcriptional regulator [Rivularia sp. PCC 7116]AFY56081.1 transcriptional regulator [Rivularia sp. PCC 7116]
MSNSQISSTRQRIINAAIELFAAQGVTETTTKAVAKSAKVNEVTLFRHFGNKHGLLLAIISESPVFQELSEYLKNQATESKSVRQALKNYCEDRLQALERSPNLVRSVVGEAGNYPLENRQALGRSLKEANHYVAEFLAIVMEREQLQAHLAPQKLASLLNIMLLGYAVMEFTSEFHELWHDKDDFLEDLVSLFLMGATNSKSLVTSELVHVEKVVDLPANTVQLILQRAKKSGLRDYALIYILFGTGLSTAEITNLERNHQICDTNQHLLQIVKGEFRQVPINQWIMGKRYGSYTNNPLTRYLKIRKDKHSALLLNNDAMPISVTEIQEYWQKIVEGLSTPEGQQPAIEQAQHTWCVEMLMKGISLENMSLITGWDLQELEPYEHRAKEKLALEQAIKLDKN